MYEIVGARLPNSVVDIHWQVAGRPVKCAGTAGRAGTQLSAPVKREGRGTCGRYHRDCKGGQGAAPISIRSVYVSQDLPIKVWENV